MTVTQKCTGQSVTVLDCAAFGRIVLGYQRNSHRENRVCGEGNSESISSLPRVMPLFQ